MFIRIALLIMALSINATVFAGAESRQLNLVGQEL
jgi:hypothetical protein